MLRTTAGLGLTAQYCSDQNTGPSAPNNQSIYQSLGNCQGKCTDNYAFAIVQGQSCWCSNYAPGDQLPIGDCNLQCPGYPYENCGNADTGLFGYLTLSKAPSGTIGSSSSTTSASKVTAPVTTQSLQTIGGSIVTRTVTLMPPTSTSTSASAANNIIAKPKMSTGSIVAIAVAVVVAAVVLFAAIIVGFCCWKRKKRNTFYEDADPVNGSTGPQRNVSVLSKAGLLGATSSNRTGSGSDKPQMAGRRNSKLQVYDQRLNPTAFMQHDDGSRSSFVSMQDNRDYTRTLNVRNPDPAD